MGVIKRQSVKNFFTAYVGVLIGFVNIMFIQPRFLTAEELGLTRILYSFALVIASFVPMGVANMTTRFFPEFRDDRTRHHGYFGFLILVTVIGFLFTASLLWLFKDFFIGKYIDNSPLFASYFHWVFPLTFLLALVIQFNIYCYSLYKSTVPAFLNDVVARSGVIVLISLYFLKLFSFKTYVILFVSVYGLQVLALLVYIYWEEKPSLRIDWPYFASRGWNRMLGYALVLWLAGLAATGLKELSTIVLGSLVRLDLVAVYVISAFIPTLIEVPLNALDRIATFKIATAWNEKNMEEIKVIYHRSSHYLFLLGGLLFLMINGNSTTLLAFLPEPYRNTEILILILSAGTLLNMATGLNGQILFTSGKYYYAAAVLIFSVVFNFILQLVFIPVYGITGAALATALSSIGINILYTWIVWRLFGMLPFERDVFLHLTFIAFLFTANWFLPRMDNMILDSFIRTTLTLAFFYVWIRKYNLIPELMQFFEKGER